MKAHRGTYAREGDGNMNRSMLLLTLLFIPISLYEDRSLSIATDKQVYSLGDTVIMTISIQNEKCREHDHILDLYIYDSSKLLVDTILLEYARGMGLRPSQFPYQVKYKPPRVESYTVKLFVFHGYYWGARYVYLEDTVTFQVVATLVTSQTTASTVISQTTSAPLTKTETLVTTITSTTIVRSTTTEVQIAKADWTIAVVAIAVVALILIALGAGKRRGRK
jgi:hypothetical protein